MPGSTLRTLRFLRAWLSRTPPVATREVVVAEEGERLPATLLDPRHGETAAPAWIVLHGVTRPGRSHPELVRFARALARSGAVVLLPQIREWTELDLAPERTVPVTRACVEHLARAGPTAGAPGLVGFSFGAPQAIRAATHPSLRGRIGGVVGFGAYFDLQRTVRFLLDGGHEWRGRRERLDPDPYGRWIIAANYLTGVPRYRGAGDVAEALRRLASAAGERRIPADDPELLPLRRRLRGEIDPARRHVFDLFAPEASAERDPDQVSRLARELSTSARKESAELDVTPHLERVPCRVELIHGREDRLIPYTETLRLRAAFPKDAPVRATITRLFSHSREASIRAGVELAREGWRFFRVLRRVLDLV